MFPNSVTFLTLCQQQAPTGGGEWGARDREHWRRSVGAQEEGACRPDLGENF